VLTQAPIAPRRLYDVARSLEAEFDMDIDLVDLHGASTVLIHQVIATGQLLYNANPAAVLNFEARSLSEYGHFRERIAPIIDSVRESGQAYAQ
jgi:hypothetical protein